MVPSPRSIPVENKGRVVIVDGRKVVFTDREAHRIRKETILTTLIRKGFWARGFLISVGSGGYFISKAL